jgi:glycosyltransferase involved in cell wall biosynthesis
MKILILADIPGWVVERIVDRMIEGIDFTFTKRFYTSISSQQFVEEANQHDLVHYGNWDLQYHLGILDQIRVPFLMSIRSFRYPSYVIDITKRSNVSTHVIHPALRDIFPGSFLIPDGIFDQFKPDHDFIIGFAGKPDEYKGFNLIAQACSELGVKFKPATGDVNPKDMYEYYKSIDLLVCASHAEGFGMPVMECLAMNKPVITTDVGIARFLNVHKIERSVESIKQGIQKFYTMNQVLPQYSWDAACDQFKKLYISLKDLKCIRTSM